MNHMALVQDCNVREYGGRARFGRTVKHVVQPTTIFFAKKCLCWKYHDIGSTNSGYSVLHVQSGCFSEVITTTPSNRGIAIPVICFGISMNNTRARRVGGEIRFRRPLGEMTSDGIWVLAPTTERSTSELLRTEKIFHRESSSRCLENTSDV